MHPVPNPNQAHSSLATTGTASTLAALGYTFNPKTDQLLVQAVGGDVRLTLNGNAPTATFGLRIADGATIQLGAVEYAVAKFITSSGSPKLEIAAYTA